MDPARAATTHPPSASSRADARTTPTTRDFSKRRRAHDDDDDDDDDGARATLVTALVAACACACAAWIKRAFDARRRATRDDRGTEKTMKEDFPTAKGTDGADDPVKKRLSFSGMSASSLASGGEEEEEKKPSRVMATRAERIEEETTTANGAETNGTKSPSAPSTPTREASREKRERQASLSPSRRPAMKLEVLGGASQGATFVASLGVDEFTVGRGRVNRSGRGERRGVHRARQVSMGWCGVDNARFRVTERHARERIDDIRWESRAGPWQRSRTATSSNSANAIRVLASPSPSSGMSPRSARLP